nr:restriction endonuclease subunit S [uncultured Flavobacterium sp.]
MNNIPQIRFPDFKKDGEWKEKKLSQIGNLINGLTYSPNDVSDKGTLVLRSSNIKNSRIVFDDNVYVTLEVNEENISKPGDILICVRNGSKSLIGKNALIQKELYNATHGAFMTVFRTKNFNFAYQLFQSDLYYKQVHADLGATINSINGKNLLNYKFHLPPSTKEQQKIADCLSSLDEVITGYQEKLKAIQNHKKGLMQNLFPKQGKTRPNYRFPEFENDGNWEEKNFDSIATFLKGKGISKADIVVDGKTPCIRYGELYTTYKETIDKVVSYTDLPVKSLLFSKANDVIIPASGETQLDIATASCVLNDNIALGGDLNIIRSTNNGVFLSYYLNNAMKYEIARMAQGNAIVHLYPHQLKTLNLQIPKFKEQQKIANCLSAVDMLIVELLNKIEQLKLHKKGLMQGLFPKIQG